FTAKWMEMLVESNPKLSRAAALWDPDTGPVQLDSVRNAAKTLNVQLEVVEAHRPSRAAGGQNEGRLMASPRNYRLSAGLTLMSTLLAQTFWRWRRKIRRSSKRGDFAISLTSNAVPPIWNFGS